MDVNTRNRAELKSYFVRNSIPTESNFAELIDGLLNQRDDGIAKLAGSPLSIEAVGDSASQKRAINFYRSFIEDTLDWTINLNPRSDANNPATARLGLSISDGEGNHRLFIDRSNGNVGIGTTQPAHRLQVSGNAAINNVFLGDVGHGATWAGFAHSSSVNTSGYGFLHSNNGQYSLINKRSGGGYIGLRVDNVDKVVLTDAGNLGIATTDPRQQLTIVGNHNIGKDTQSGMSYGGNIAIKGNAPQIDFIDTDHNDWSIHVNSNRMYFIRQPWEAADLVLDGAGAIGIGVQAPGAKLHIIHAAQDANGNALIVGPTNAANLRFGYHADYSWIQAHGSKPLAINPLGNNVGIGLTNPQQLLVVAGNFNASKDPQSGLTNGGSFAIKSNAPQIDFLDTDHNDWAIHVNSNKMYFIRQPWTFTDLVLDGAGNVGVGTDVPADRLHVNGNIRIDGEILKNGDWGMVGGGTLSPARVRIGELWGASGVYGFPGILKLGSAGGMVVYRGIFGVDSSRTLKDDITALAVDEAFAILEGLNPVTFSLKEDEARIRQAGFVAEDVPDLIATSDRTAVIHNHIVTVLTKVVQEQQRAIEVLTNRLEALSAD